MPITMIRLLEQQHRLTPLVWVKRERERERERGRQITSEHGLTFLQRRLPLCRTRSLHFHTPESPSLQRPARQHTMRHIAHQSAMGLFRFSEMELESYDSDSSLALFGSDSGFDLRHAGLGIRLWLELCFVPYTGDLRNSQTIERFVYNWLSILTIHKDARLKSYYLWKMPWCWPIIRLGSNFYAVRNWILFVFEPSLDSDSSPAQ